MLSTTDGKRTLMENAHCQACDCPQYYQHDPPCDQPTGLYKPTSGLQTNGAGGLYALVYTTLYNQFIQTTRHRKLLEEFV